MKKIIPVISLSLSASIFLTSCSFKIPDLTSFGKSSGTPASSGQSEGPNSTESTTSTPGKQNGKLVFPNMPDYNGYFDFEATEYSEEGRKVISEEHEFLTGMIGTDIPAAINGAIEKYGKHFLDYIPEYALKAAVRPMTGEPFLRQKIEGNVTGITDDALSKVNKFLGENDLEPLDAKDPEQNVAAFAIAAMLLHKGTGEIGMVDGLAEAFTDACCNSDETRAKELAKNTLYAIYLHFLE